MRETTREEIGAYDAEIARLRNALKEIEGKRHKALLRPFGIEPGDVVRSTTRSGPWKDCLGKVVIISTPYQLGSRPCVIVNPQKKDGSFGERQITWFDWEKVPEEQPA